MPNLAKTQKSQLHPRNLHRDGYPFEQLVHSFPALQPYVMNHGDGGRIDFSDPSAVKALNAALLTFYYNVDLWDVPTGYLCPAVPGRADYIHYVADLLAESNAGLILTGRSIVGLDIGVGANAIYPIIGSQIYGWRFVGSEIDPVSVASSQMIVQGNAKLNKLVTIRQQRDAASIFNGLIKPQDKFAFTMCNPPFFNSAEQAQQANLSKNLKLTRHKNKRQSSVQGKVKISTEPQFGMNFAGQANELYCHGGELAFIRNMIEQSKGYAQQVGWFTTLVSNKDHLKPIYQCLEKYAVTEHKTVAMAQGQKQSRFVAWRF